MGKKFFAAMIVVVVAIFAGYNVYQSQDNTKCSNLVLANIDALANNGEVSTGDCIPDERYSCEALHPTDPTKDETKDDAVWK